MSQGNDDHITAEIPEDLPISARVINEKMEESKLVTPVRTPRTDQIIQHDSI